MVLRSASVARRLILGFGCVALLVLVFAGVAGSMLRDIRGSVTQVVEDRYPKLELVRDVRDGVNDQVRALLTAVIAAEARQADQARTAIADVERITAANTERMRTLKSMVKSPAGQALLKTMVDARAAYGQTRDQAVRHLRDGHGDQAGALIVGELRTRQETLFAAIAALVTFQQDQMATAAGEATGVADRAVGVSVGVAGGVLALAMLMAWVITRSVLRELGGEPAAAREAADRIARGDLSQPIRLRAGDTGSLFATLHAMQEALSGTVGRVRQASEAVAGASTEIAQGNQDLSNRTEQQASALQETAATMEALGSTVRNNADNTRQANQLAQAAATVAAQGGEVVGRVVTTMQGISESSRRIGDIIGVIDGIAFQTNILALNAAVEAARAGEQGRGFAVVASEVRSLAQRSAEAAKEIKVLIGRNVEQVEQGGTLVVDAGNTMEEIVGSIRRVSDLVGEISAATTEQSERIRQVGDAVAQMDGSTQQNAALVEQSASAAESLKQQAQQLVEAVAIFRLALDAGTRLQPQGPGPQAAAPAASARPASAKPAVARPSARKSGPAAASMPTTGSASTPRARAAAARPPGVSAPATAAAAAPRPAAAGRPASSPGRAGASHAARAEPAARPAPPAPRAGAGDDWTEF
jgi:methyl-accepting chemotaxis protein